MQVLWMQVLVIMSGTVRRVISDETLGMSKRVRVTATTQNYQLILTFQLHFAFFRPSDTLACLAIRKVKRAICESSDDASAPWKRVPVINETVFSAFGVVKCVSLQTSRLSQRKKLLPGATALPERLLNVLPLHHSFSTEKKFFVSSKRVLSWSWKGMLHVNHHKTKKINHEKNNKTHASLNETKAIVVHLWKTIVKWWWWTASCVSTPREKEKESKTQKALVDVCLGPGVGIAFVSAS